MKVKIVKQVMACDVSPVAMFKYALSSLNCTSCDKSTEERRYCPDWLAKNICCLSIWNDFVALQRICFVTELLENGLSKTVLSYSFYTYILLVLIS